MNGEPPAVPQRPQKRPISLFRALLIWAVLLAALLMVFPGMIFVQCISTIYRADEGFKSARRTIDPEELRKWALQEIKKRGGADDPTIPRTEIPDYIQKLYSSRPEDATAIKATGDQSFVAIVWGGGFFHWGMKIGDTNFTLPYMNQNSDYLYNFMWTNGIYYSRETDYKLW